MTVRPLLRSHWGWRQVPELTSWPRARAVGHDQQAEPWWPSFSDLVHVAWFKVDPVLQLTWSILSEPTCTPEPSKRNTRPTPTQSWSSLLSPAWRLSLIPFLGLPVPDPLTLISETSPGARRCFGWNPDVLSGHGQCHHPLPLAQSSSSD